MLKNPIYNIFIIIFILKILFFIKINNKSLLKSYISISIIDNIKGINTLYHHLNSIKSSINPNNEFKLINNNIG